MQPVGHRLVRERNFLRRQCCVKITLYLHVWELGDFEVCCGSATIGFFIVFTSNDVDEKKKKINVLSFFAALCLLDIRVLRDFSKDT